MNAPPKLRPVDFRWTGQLGDFVTALAWSPDGSRLAAASVSGEASIYDADAGKVIHTWKEAHAGGCDAIAWRPDGKALATAGRDGTWKLWDVSSGLSLVEHEAGALWAEHLTWSLQPVDGKGHILAVGAGNKVSFWDEKGARGAESMTFSRTVADLAWIEEGTLAVATSSGVSVRDVLTADEKRVFKAGDPILNMAFSPSGKWLMTGNQDCSIHVWNTGNGVEMHMRGYAAKVRRMAWHRGSRWLAAGGSPSVTIWDCSGRGPEGRTPLLLEEHTDLVSALQYQPAGDWLASGSRDGGIAIWSPTQRQQLITRAKISGEVTQLAWSPDGRMLAVGGDDGVVQALTVE